MPNTAEGLSDALIEAVLTKLGLSGRPETTLTGLESVYSAWRRRVPFDNIRKMTHVRRDDPAPLPGDTAEDFFQSWVTTRSLQGDDRSRFLIDEIGIHEEVVQSLPPDMPAPRTPPPARE